MNEIPIWVTLVVLRVDDRSGCYVRTESPLGGEIGLGYQVPSSFRLRGVSVR